MKKLYKHVKYDRDADEYIRIITMTISVGSGESTLTDGLCNPRYRIASWIGIIYMVFHELTGINVINIYSNKMFEDM